MIRRFVWYGEVGGICTIRVIVSYVEGITRGLPGGTSMTNNYIMNVPVYSFTDEAYSTLLPPAGTEEPRVAAKEAMSNISSWCKCR